MATFFRGAGRHLTDRGGMLVFFGTSGDLGHLTRLIEQERFRSEVVAHEGLDRGGRHVDYFTYRLLP